MLIKSEQIAERILIELGWEPVRMTVNTRLQINVGMPDFRCSGNRYVEVKKEKPKSITRESKYGQYFLQLAQLDVFSDLIFDGNEIYILVLSCDYDKYAMFKIESLNYKQREIIPQQRISQPPQPIVV